MVAAPGVPVGDYTRTVLRTLGLEAALERVVSEEADVTVVVAKVALGEADAGFAYATDVPPVRGEVRAIAVPRSAQPAIRYQVAVVTASKHAEAARRFVAALTGPRGRAAMRRAGFVAPP